jgi:hypothetical protein
LGISQNLRLGRRISDQFALRFIKMLINAENLSVSESFIANSVMHIGFLNPQGNFDRSDSHWTEHPDFGGQWVYVKNVAIAMEKHGHTVDILTRQIIDPDWPEFARDISKNRHDLPAIVAAPMVRYAGANSTLLLPLPLPLID